MANETGNQLQVAFIAEVTFKTTPTTPTGQILRYTGFSLAGDAAFLANPELRTDRQKAAGRRGAIIGKGELSGVLSSTTYDAFIEAALGGTWTANVVKVGTTRKSFTFEKKYSVNTLCFPFTGVVVDSMELTGKADQNVEIKFGLIAATCGTESGTTIWSSTTAAGTTAIHNTWVGSVKKGGSTIAAVTGFTLKADNGYQEAKVIGSADLYDLQPMSIGVTGSLEMFFDSYALYTDFRAESAVTLQINIGSGSGSYTFDLTNARITKFGAPTQTDGMTQVTVEFESFTEATQTSLKVTRVP